jgi:hypothetical protein
MKRIQWLAASVAILVSISSYGQTVDEIMAKHVEALGGADKLKGVKSIVQESTVAVQGMEFPNTTTILIGKGMRNETSIMGNTMIQAVSADKGWQVRPAMMGGTGEPEDMPAEMLKGMGSQLNPFADVLDYKASGNKVELVGKEQLDKKDVYHLKITTKDGKVSDQYIDAGTYMVSKVKSTGEQGENEILMSDYKAVDGIKFAHTREINGQQSLVITTNKVVVNGPVDESIFSKPAK